jgi:ApbE family protein
MTACNSDESESKTEIFAMDTYVTIEAFGENSEKAVSDAEQEIKRLENLWSVTDENSEIYAVNHSGGQPVFISDETAELIEYALEISDLTDGALDISLYPVLLEWGFTTGEYKIPDEETLQNLLIRTGYEKVKLDGNYINLEDEMQIDLGAVGKGFTGDLLVEKIKENSVKSALINLGGNVQTIGTKPDGSDWKVGITSPYGEGNFAVLEISDKAIVTSGGYERYFIGEDGRQYHHILNPETGKPAESGLISVSVIASEGRLCDALSTSLFVMGLEKAENLWKSKNDFDMILVTENGEIYITEGIEDNFSLNTMYSNLEVSVIHR